MLVIGSIINRACRRSRCYTRSAADWQTELDLRVKEEYLPQLESSGTKALEALLSQVFPSSDFPQTAAALERTLMVRRAF